MGKQWRHALACAALDSCAACAAVELQLRTRLAGRSHRSLPRCRYSQAESSPQPSAFLGTFAQSVFSFQRFCKHFVALGNAQCVCLQVSDALERWRFVLSTPVSARISHSLSTPTHPMLRSYRYSHSLTKSGGSRQWKMLLERT